MSETEKPQYTKPSEYVKMAERADENVPTIPLDLPSGAVWIVRRPSVETWLFSGRIPQHLVLKALEAGRRMRGAKAEEAFEGVLAQLAPDVSDAETLQILVFARDLVREAVVLPHIIVLNPGEDAATKKLGEDDILADKIHPLDFWHIFRWASEGAKGVPVLTVKGATTVETVENFRRGEEWRPLSNAGANQPNDAGAGV